MSKSEGNEETSRASLPGMALPVQAAPLAKATTDVALTAIVDEMQTTLGTAEALAGFRADLELSIASIRASQPGCDSITVAAASLRVAEAKAVLAGAADDAGWIAAARALRQAIVALYQAEMAAIERARALDSAEDGARRADDQA